VLGVGVVGGGVGAGVQLQSAIITPPIFISLLLIMLSIQMLPVVIKTSPLLRVAVLWPVVAYQVR